MSLLLLACNVLKIKANDFQQPGFPQDEAMNYRHFPYCPFLPQIPTVHRINYQYQYQQCLANINYSDFRHQLFARSKKQNMWFIAQRTNIIQWVITTVDRDGEKRSRRKRETVSVAA